MGYGMRIEVLLNREPSMADWTLILLDVIANSLDVFVQVPLLTETLRTVRALERLQLSVNGLPMSFEMLASLKAASTFGARKRFLLQVDVSHVTHQNVLSVESDPALGTFEPVLESIAVAVDGLHVTDQMNSLSEGALTFGALNGLSGTVDGLQVVLQMITSAEGVRAFGASIRPVLFIFVGGPDVTVQDILPCKGLGAFSTRETSVIFVDGSHMTLHMMPLTETAKTYFAMEGFCHLEFSLL